MIEYEKNIQYFSKHWWAHYTQIMNESEWGNENIGRLYLEKYWLPQEEYEKVWKPIQDSIFINQDKGLPNYIFAKQFDFIALRGGSLFLEEDFVQLQRCLKIIGEKYFVVIENTYGGKLDEPAFRLKFPTDITWNELMSGNFISSIVIEMLHNEYFVFGLNRNWGKYSANDYENPLNLIGFKSEVQSVFKEYLIQTVDEQNEIKNWLPKTW